MKKNMGNADRTIRLIIAAVLAWLYFANYVTGILGIVLLVLAAIFVVTSLFSVCPLYLPFNIRTHSSKEQQ